MDNSQKVINTSADGDYDFKGLHCSIVGKSVGAIFSAGNDYTIRYTNFNPRSIQDKPDAFEAAALESFDADARRASTTAWRNSTARSASAICRRSKWTKAAWSAMASLSARSTSQATPRKAGRSTRWAAPSASSSQWTSKTRL